MRYRKYLAIFSLALATAIQAQEASALSCPYLVTAALASLESSFHEPIKQALMPLIYNPQELSVEDLNHENSPVNMKFGTRLGYGLYGSVYPVEQITGIPILEKLVADGNLLAKLPHRWDMTKALLPRREMAAQAEGQLNNLYKSNLSSIEADKEFPTNAAWERGTLPSVPILYSLKSEAGTIHFKFKVKGMGIEKIKEKYHPTKIEDLPPEMFKSIKDIYDFAEAAFRQNELHNPGQARRLDINPTNLVWIEDPVELKRLSMNKPGFILFEIGEQFSNVDFTYQEYLKTFMNFLQQQKSQP